MSSGLLPFSWKKRIRCPTTKVLRCSLSQREALERNEKPEGYNRKGRMRLIFPIDSKQFYIKSISASVEVGRMGEKLSKILTKAGIKHTLDWNMLGDY